MLPLPMVPAASPGVRWLPLRTGGLVSRLARELTGDSYGAGLAAVVLVRACLPLNLWGSQGMEVAPPAPLLTGTLLLALRHLGSHAADACGLPQAIAAAK